MCARDASGRVWESNPARLQLADELGEPGLSHKERLQTKSRQHIDPGDAYHKKKKISLSHIWMQPAGLEKESPCLEYPKKSLKKKKSATLADHQNKPTLRPSAEIVVCRRVISSQIKTGIKEARIYA